MKLLIIFKKLFNKRLQEKTNWGRNDIKALVEELVDQVIIERGGNEVDS